MKGLFHLAIKFFFLVAFLFPDAGSAAQEPAEELKRLKENDQLAEWLYLRMSFSAEKPEERLSFLMASQKEAWRKPKNLPEKEAWLNLLLNQGYYHLYTGNILKSITQYEEAYAFFQKNPLKGFNITEYLFKPLGNNYTRLGDYSRALYIQKKSLESALRQQDKRLIASLYSNIAISYKSLGDLQQAKKMCLTGFEYLDEQDDLYALLKCTLADIYYEQRLYIDAEREVQKALKILNSRKLTGNEAYWLLSAYTLAGNIALKEHIYPKSLFFYKKGLQLIDVQFENGRKRERAGLLNQLGTVQLQLNRPKAALDYFNQALHTLLPGSKGVTKNRPSVNELYGENRLYDALEGRSRALISMNKTEAALENMLLALHTGDKARSEFASKVDRVYYQKQSKVLAERALKTAWDFWKKTGEDRFANIILNLAEHSKARTLLDEIEKNRRYLSLNNKDSIFNKREQLKQAIVLYEKEYLLEEKKGTGLLSNKQEAEFQLALLEKEVRKKYPAWEKQANTASFVKLSIDKIPSGFTVINFFWGEKEVYGIKLQKDKIVDIIRLSDAEEWRRRIGNYVNVYYKNGPAAMIDSPHVFYSESQAIYNYLLKDLLPEYPQNLIVIPDDILGYLPFDALMSPGKFSADIKRWPFLIKKTKLSYAYSLQSWLVPQEEKEGMRFSGFFLTKSFGGNAAIPAATLEAESLRKNLYGNFVFNEGATLTRFKNALGQSQVLHISTHSFPFGKQAEPALQFADGNFFLFELGAQQQVPGLVVLSACRTADGLMASGEGVLSLSRGFTAAGAGGTVAGLWNVNDKATAMQMVMFYDKLQKSKNPADALYQVKLRWLNQEQKNPAMLLPYYWASLVYIGKPLIVDVESKSFYTSRYLFSAAAVVVISICILVICKKRYRC